MSYFVFLLYYNFSKITLSLCLYHAKLLFHIYISKLKHNDIIKISLITCPMHQCVCLETFIFNKNISFLSSYSLKIKYVY